MTSRNGQSKDFRSIKLQFMEEWDTGKGPTLEEYAGRYPEFAEELAEFIPDFLELEAVESEDTLADSPSPAAERALKRVLAGVLAPASSLRDVRKGMGWSHAHLARELNLPRVVVIQLERGAIRDWPARLEAQLVRTVARAPEEIAMLLGSPRGPSSAAAHYSATGSPERDSAVVRTFKEALEECSLRGELTEAQRREWLDESST